MGMDVFSGAHLLLGNAATGELILLVGPEYGRLQQLAADAGIEVREASQVGDVRMLKAGLALSGRSLALIASIPEVEGLLDRASFGRDLSELAFQADRVVYGGSDGTVLVHPRYPGTRMEVTQGTVRFSQTLNTIEGENAKATVSAR